MREVIAALAEWLTRGRDGLLCQVVETRGSTPQKAGAALLLGRDGFQIGTLGGGCVEAEVKQKALRQLDQPGAVLHSHVLDHDHAWADGLICGGKMVIVSEWLQGEAPVAYFKALGDLLERGGGGTEVVVVDPAQCGQARLGTRYLIDDSGETIATWPPHSAVPGFEFDRRAARVVSKGLAYLPLRPRITLVIVGAGHVGVAVGELAARCDFDVCMIDDRAQYANADRCGFARQILVGPIDEVLAALDLTPNHYALIVTRGHGHDQEALYHLAAAPASYVGLIGSKRKIRMIYDALMAAGVPRESLARVAAPVGLEIGSESVPEIAVSIVAELIARRNQGPQAVLARGWIPPESERSASCQS